MPSPRALVPTLGRWPRRLAALACLLLAAVSALGSGHSAHAEAHTKPVVVARRDLPAGHQLGAQDIAVARWPARLIPHGASHDPAALLGRRVAAPLPRHAPVLRSRVLGPGLTAGLGRDQVAAPVRVVNPAAGALLRPGEHVELLAAAAPPPVDAGASQDGTPPPVVLSPDALVLAVVPEHDGATGLANGSGTLLIVAVERASAGRLATQTGARVLALVGKPP